MNQPNKTEKHLSPTVWYILTGLLWTWPAFILSGGLLPDWRAGDIASSLTLADIHALILGALLTTACGVLYQVIPIAFQAPPIDRQVAKWHLPAHTGSVLVMVVGFLLNRWSVVAVGGSILFAATIVFGGHVLRSYRRARNPTAVHQQLLLPFICIVIVMILGIMMASGWSDPENRLLLTHALLGVFGFWLGLIMIVSYKFIPMFSLSHGYKVSVQVTVRLFYAGVGLFFIAGFGPLRLGSLLRGGGALLCAAAVALFALDMRRILAARKRKRIVPALRYALLATGLILAGTLMLLTAVLSGDMAWIAPGSYLALFGGFMALTLSYAQKIVPFLWFEYRFSHSPDRKAAPALDDMMPKKPVAIGMFLYFLSVLGGVVLLLPIGPPPGNRVGETVGLLIGIIACGGSGSLFYGLTRVLMTSGRRPA
ncbi:MAG: hypothetical protein ACYCVB_03695 [Bacilli bacterium]